MRYLTSLAITGSLLLLSAASAGTAELTVEQRCVSQKAKAMWKYSRCVTKTQVRAIKKDLSEAEAKELIDFCLARLRSRFERADARANLECATSDIDPGTPNAFHGPLHASLSADAQQCFACHKK